MHIIKLYSTISQSTYDCFTPDFDIKCIIRALKCRWSYSGCTILWWKPSKISNIFWFLRYPSLKWFKTYCFIDYMIKDSCICFLTLLSSVLCIMIVLVSFSIYDATQENLILLRINAHFSMIDCPAAEKFVVECVHRRYCAPTASPMSFVLSFSSSKI